jgi:hypothetical protein
MLTRCNFLFFQLATGEQEGINGGQTTTSLHELFPGDFQTRRKYMEISTLEGINTQHYTL